jgi:hypothetical protein
MANKANLANSVLFAPLSDSDTELEVYTGDGSLFPAVPFYLTISPKNKWSRKINSEIVLVTAKSTDTFSITRAQKGTTAQEFSYGDLVANGIYKEDLDDVLSDAATASNAAIASAISAAKQALMPVGFVVTLGVSTNPATLFGFGTWSAITGRVIVGRDSGQTEFDTLNETGGAKTHTLTTAEMPSHTHDFRYPAAGSGGGINDLYGIPYNPTANAGMFTQSGVPPTSGETRSGNLNAGGGGAHNNLQPYIVKYVWERIA